jgi:hypothetical protein
MLMALGGVGRRSPAPCKFLVNTLRVSRVMPLSNTNSEGPA